MQARKRSLWVVMGLLIAGQFLLAGANHPIHLPKTTPLPRVMGEWALLLNILTPVGVGGLLADRFVRDQVLGTAELLDASPADPGARAWGKTVGALAATITPLAMWWLGLVVVLAVSRGEPAALAVGLAAFVAINVPALLLVGAFSVTLPALVWPPLYRTLFAAYWLWGNLFNPHLLPTLSGTALAPVGEYAAGGLFGAHLLYAPLRGIERVTPLAGTLSVVLLLAISGAPLLMLRALVGRSASRL
jgi:ABC-type Na+ efflux pump permease subunit